MTPDEIITLMQIDNTRVTELGWGLLDADLRKPDRVASDYRDALALRLAIQTQRTLAHALRNAAEAHAPEPELPLEQEGFAAS